MKLKRLFTLLTSVVLACGVSAQKDVTSQYITNATLSNGTTGWTVSNFNNPVRGNNTVGYASESYAGWGALEKTSFHLKQNITLPAGNYTLVNYSFFRQGEAYSTNSTKSLAKLKAGNKEVNLKTLGSITASGYANSQAEGANCFDAKMYRNTVDFTIAADNTTIEIGIEGTFDVMRSWCIVGMFELINNDIPATMDAPFDVTGYMTNPGFEYRDMTGWTLDPSGSFGTQNNNQGFKVGGFYAEKWQASGALTARSMSQKISDLPAGYYKLTANLGGNGTYIGLNGKTVNWESDKDYTVGYVLAENEDLTITAGKTAEGTANWIHFDNFRLQFCGDVQAALTTLIGQLSNYESKLPSAVYSTLLSDVSAYDKSYSDVDELLAAIADVQNLYSTADEKSTIYIGVKDLISAYAEKAAKLDVAGQSAYDVSAITTKNNTEGYESLSNAETDLSAALAEATKAQTTVGSDWTGLITNPSFENGFTGWTNEGMATQNNTSFGKTGSYYAECWQPNGTKSVSQTIKGLPAGVYRLTARAKARTVNSARIFAAGINQDVTIEDSEKNYDVDFACDDNADILIGFVGVGTGADASWLCVDNFTLKLVSAGLPDVEAVTGNMNADVATAQTSAVETYEASRTVANYNAAVAAINAAQASKDAYAVAGQAIAAANALKDAQNFASATAITTFAEAIAAIETPYNNNTLADNVAAAAGTSLGSVVTGWHAAAGSAAVAYLNDGFSLNAFDAALYINTWSTEGETDGSNFKVPFYEYFAGDGSKLPENTWTGTLTGLENGLYSVSAWVRVRSMNGETAVADLTGITMDVNGGTAIDVTEGNQIGESRFQLKEYTAEGLVKNGTLNINFNIASDNNIHWLSFKNINYTKVRDLTPEEAAIVPMDLAIDATKTVFVDKTVTLTPTSTTNEASISGFVTWTSDDTSVATVDENGVVTAKAYGTANITVTSTLNSSATATCVVTVTAPTYDQLVNLDFAEGPVVNNHIRTYAKDKTGTDVAQMQEVTGWTMAVANGDAKAAGVMAYGSSYGMGSADINAPATNPNGEDTGNVFGMVGVWTGSVQYIQKMKLPAGAYTITVPVYRNGGGTALSKNLIGVILDDNTEYLASTKTYDSGKWTTETIKFTITSDTFGKLSIGLNSQNVGSGSSQRLWLDGITIKYEPFATSSEIATLNTAIGTAENNHPLGFEDGQYAPYNNVAALKVVAAAKALNTTDPIAQSEVTGATTAVESATWNANVGDVDAIYNGMFATVAEGQNYPDGWKRTNGWGQMRSDISGDYATAYYNQPGSLQYGNQGVYTMPLAGNQAYKLTFSYRSHENNSNNGVTVSVKNGDDGLNDVVFSKNGSTSNWKTVEAYFTTGAAGNYVLTLANNGNTWMTNVSLVKVTSAAIEISENASFTPAEKYANITLDRTIKADTWNSFVVPFDITNDELKAAFGDEVAVAEFSENSADENDVQVAFNSMTTPAITANTPVLLKGNAGTSFEFSGKKIKEGEAKVAGTNVDFVGSYAASIQVAAGNYFISNNTIYKSAGQNTLKGTRAYIDAKNVSNVRMFIDDMETSISEIDNDSMRNGEIIYNMAGQRVSKAQKGLYIVNGRKVIVK